MNSTENESKTQLLKSTVIVGTSQALTIFLQVIRTKLIAVLLGPVGVGLVGIYNTIVDLVRSITGLGINFSGVREIAMSSGDNSKVAGKALLLKRWSIATGIIGGVGLILLCYPISIISFGDASYALGIAVLSIAVVFTSITQSQIALLQGLRKLVYMAKASVIGVALSIVFVLPIYYFWSLRGIVCAIVLMSFSSYVLSRHYVRKLNIPNVKLSYKSTWLDGREMIKLGFASSISAIVTTATMYLLRSFITNNGPLDNVGFFQASWTISNVYLLSVLNAMAADYFPRLSAINRDNYKLCKLVNDQVEIATIIGGVLVVVMISCSSIIIDILYSKDFHQSSILLMFFSLGSFFKLLSWPISFVLSAKGSIKGIIISEFSWNIFFIALSTGLWSKFGLLAVGISYVVSYVIYLFIVFYLVDRICKFRWSKTNVKHIITFFTLVIMVFVNSYVFNSYWSVSFLLIAVCFLYAYSYLNKVVGINGIFKKIFNKK